MAARAPHARYAALELRAAQVSRANQVFGDDGKLTDETMGKQPAKFVAGFAAFAAGLRGR